MSPLIIDRADGRTCIRTMVPAVNTPYKRYVCPKPMKKDQPLPVPRPGAVRLDNDCHHEFPQLDCIVPVRTSTERPVPLP